jgi:hypothetical protein
VRANISTLILSGHINKPPTYFLLYFTNTLFKVISNRNLLIDLMPKLLEMSEL